MWKILKQIAKTGIATEAPPKASDIEASERIHDEILKILGRALTIREVDTGSCNGCELEINALGNVYYNLEGLGIKFVASPRHADMLLVTGPLSRNMAQALQLTYEATPEPKLVVAVGDCAINGGIFGASMPHWWRRQSIDRRSGDPWLSARTDRNSSRNLDCGALIACPKSLMRLYPRQVRHHSELWKIKMFEGKRAQRARWVHA